MVPGTDKTYLDKLFANIKGHPNFDKGAGKDNFVVKVPPAADNGPPGADCRVE